MHDAMDLHGRVAVITGGAKGLGSGIVRRMAYYGATVVINYHNHPQQAELLQQAIVMNGGKAIIFPADVTSEDQVASMMEAAYREFGRIDILVSNAALQTNLELPDYDDESYDRVMRVNCIGYVNCMRQALPYLKSSPAGRIINILSIHAKRPTEFDPIYSMSKGALKMLTREAALEFAKYNIKVNGVELGAVALEQAKSGSHNNVMAAYAQEPNIITFRRISVQKRPCLPDDVGEIVSFLAGDAAETITGSGFRMDNGTMIL